MRYLLIIFLVAGCSRLDTFEESNHLFTATRAVIKNQPGWRQPDVLEIVQVATRQAICQQCNDIRAGGKGSHFNFLGLHRASVQDRGCYRHSTGLSLGRVYYLADDAEALAHEKDHHYYGPAHANPRPKKRWPHLSNRAGWITGSRIETVWRR